jgi:uncharacterized membrane protein YgcG
VFSNERKRSFGSADLMRMCCVQDVLRYNRVAMKSKTARVICVGWQEEQAELLLIVLLYSTAILFKQNSVPTRQVLQRWQHPTCCCAESSATAQIGGAALTQSLDLRSWQLYVLQECSCIRGGGGGGGSGGGDGGGFVGGEDRIGGVYGGGGGVLCVSA